MEVSVENWAMDASVDGLSAVTSRETDDLHLQDGEDDLDRER